MRKSLVVLSFFLSSCTVFIEKLRDATNTNISTNSETTEYSTQDSRSAEDGSEVAISLREHIDGHPNLKSWSSEDLESDLSRSGKAGYYNARVVPQTLPLLEAEIREREIRNMTDSETIENMVKDAQKAAKKRTCFMVYIDGGLTLDSVRTRYWVAKLKVEMKVYDLSFSNPNDIPNHSSGGWYNIDMACTNENPDLRKGFHVYLIPQLAEEGRIELAWSP